MAVFTPHMGILSEAQRALWPSLGNAMHQGFVLYGGTAVALRLGHRTSVDFDFFTDRPLQRNELHAALPVLAKATVLQDEHESLTMLAGSREAEVKLSFFGAVGFGRVGEPQFTEDRIMQVASIEDLLATRLKVILQRSESKDYLDIAAMLRAGADLSAGLAAARALFGREFQPSESLKALTYFKDGDLGTLGSEIEAFLVRAASRVRELPAAKLRSRNLQLPS